jgi:hypothetical protein
MFGDLGELAESFLVISDGVVEVEELDFHLIGHLTL